MASCSSIWCTLTKYRRLGLSAPNYRLSTMMVRDCCREREREEFRRAASAIVLVFTHISIVSITGITFQALRGIFPHMQLCSGTFPILALSHIIAIL